MEEDHEEDLSLFSNFPSPFFDEFTTISIPENKHTHQQHKPLNITEPSLSPSESKRLNKKRTCRHSKIYTAQGYRDRRMRLSLHIARKFFDLQDLLGFDKASKTIEWLFCKSNKAIKEISDNFNPQQSSCYKEIGNNEIKNDEGLSLFGLPESASNPTSHFDVRSTSELFNGCFQPIPIGNNEIKADKTKENEIKNKKISRKKIQKNYSIKVMRDQARARARDRTRRRMMIKELEKSNEFFIGNPKDEIHKLGLGYSMNPNNHNSQSDPMQPDFLSSHSFEQYSSIAHDHHLLQDLQSETVNSYIHQADWLNSSNGFLRVPEELDADIMSFVTDYSNC